jgi:hypothetical protein
MKETTPQAGHRNRPRDPDKWIERPIEKYRKDSKYVLPFRPCPAFFDLADSVVLSRRTRLGYDRLYVFWQSIQNVMDVPGSVVEVGTYRGGSAYFIANTFVTLAGAEVPFHVFDTFSGHPDHAISEHDPFQQAGQFDDTSYDDVRAYLSPFARIQVHPGDVLTQLPRLEESAYRLVHLDTDLYLPTKACLDYFAARLSTGGVLVIDDYASQKCPGVRAAACEYLDATNRLQAWDMRTEQLVLVKR